MKCCRQVRLCLDAAQRKDVHHSAGREAVGMQMEGRMAGKGRKGVGRTLLIISEAVGRCDSVVTQQPSF